MNAPNHAYKSILRWVMVEFLDSSESHGGGTHIPAHLCEFDTNPEKGACTFHELWFEAAELAGLMDEFDAADSELTGSEV